MVGGYAVSRHAQPRYTKDLDILILILPANAKAVFRGLSEFGAPLHTRADLDTTAVAPPRALTAKDFEDIGTWYTMGVPPCAIDILPEIPGVTFDAAWNNRSTQVVDDTTGLTAHFMSRDDLIATKLAAGRDRISPMSKRFEMRRLHRQPPTLSQRPPNQRRSAKRSCRASRRSESNPLQELVGKPA